MARSFNGTSQYLRASSTPITSAPLTVACWFYARSVVDECLVNLSNGTQTYQWRLYFYNSAALEWKSNNGSGYAAIGFDDVNVWHHAAGVEIASDERRVYLDGSYGTNFAPATPSGINGLTVGGDDTGTSYLFYGNLAEVGIWNVALNEFEVAALAKGVSPLRIRPQNLVCYYPMYRGGNIDEFNYAGSSYTLTNYNWPGNVAHPPVMPPLAGFGRWRATSFPSFYQGDMMPLLF